MPQVEPEVQAVIDRRTRERLLAAAKAEGVSDKMAQEMVNDTERAIKHGRIWQGIYDVIFNGGKSIG